MKPTIILVHGLYMNGFSMEKLAYYFRTQQYKTIIFSYSTLWDDYQKSCQEFANLLNKTKGPCAIICHSLGGLITQGALSLISSPEHKVTHVISMGTPWQGARVAGEIKRKHLELLAGKKLSVLLPKKNKNVWSYEIPLGSIAGKSSFGIGRLFSSRQVFSDGTVEVEETKIEGMTDHTVILSFHTGMIFSRNVAESCRYFIEHGHFKKE